MKEISKSTDRHTFSLNNYLKQCKKEGTVPDQKLLDENKRIKDEHTNAGRFLNRNIEHDLEYDLLTTPWILEKVRKDTTYAQNLYAALCNNNFVKNEIFPILQEEYCSYSWRYAGGIIADMREEGDYIDWYCSGYTKDPGRVPEGTVTDEIHNDLLKLGWKIITE